MLNVSLMIIDNIHFQYNGFLIGLLLFSVYFSENHPKISAIFFTCLVFTKHYFLVLCPIWLTFLIYVCFVNSKKRFTYFIYNSFTILITVIIISAIAMAPIFLTNQTSAFFSRLFPVSRSYIHFFPASNPYSIYAVLDKLFAKFKFKFCKSYVIDPDGHYIKSMRCLPPVNPLFCIIICILLNLPVLLRLWKNLKEKRNVHSNMLYSISLSLLISFIFGYHIHEKQLVYALIPLGLYTYLFNDKKNEIMSNYLFLNTWTNISMMVLLEKYPENIIKYILVLINYISQFSFSKIDSNKYKFHHLAIILSISIIFLFEFVIQKLILNNLGLKFIYHMLSPMVCTPPIIFYSFKLYCYWIFNKI